jgi:hypothetical protein
MGTSAAVATTLVGASLLSQAQAYIKFVQYKDPENCYRTPCKDIDENTLTYRMTEALNVLSANKATWYEQMTGKFKKDQEFLRLHVGHHPNNKILFFVGADDEKGELHPKHVAGFVNQLSKSSDLKYMVVYSPDKICSQIQEAAKIGTLTNVIIEALGNEKEILLSDPTSEKGWFNEKTENLKECLVNITGRITLISSLTGAGSYPLAQKIADIAEREVIAPGEMVTPEKLSFSEGHFLKIFHPSAQDRRINAFKLFRPSIAAECQKVEESALHPREKAAAELVLKTLQEKGLLQANGFGFEQWKQFLQFCKGAKEKVLFLSAAYDPTGTLEPSKYQEFLGQVAALYDFKFKVFNNNEEICREIQQAAQYGNVEYAFLNAYGGPEGFCIAENCDLIDNWIHTNEPKDWKKCFTGMKDEAKLIFLTSGSGDIEGRSVNETIAGLIAEIAQKTVIAPSEDLIPEKITLQDRGNMDIYHPSASQGFWDWITFQKPENIFKKFNP